MLSHWFNLRLAKPAAAALLLALGVSACATGPVYVPRGPGQSVGYTDQRLTENRFRVTFSGNSATRREEVEDHLMRRAAEVTLQNGFSHFVFDARDTEGETYYRSSFIPRSYLGFGYGLGPRYWRRPYWGPRFGYYSSFGFGHPWWGYDHFDAYPITRYHAYSEIITLTPEQAQNQPEALDARQILASLPPLPPPPAS
jgi:hypothetical protein